MSTSRPPLIASVVCLARKLQSWSEWTFDAERTGSLSLYMLYICISRLLIHPLHNFPGPRLAAATFLYEAYFDILKTPGSQYNYQIDRLHDIYGPFVRVSPEEIHVRDSEWFDVLYTGPGHVRDKWERSNRANGSGGSVASSVPHDLHRKRRSAINPYFSERAVAELESKLRSKVDLMCYRLRECAEHDMTIDVGAALTAFTMDVISEYCYDRSYNCLEQPDFAPQWKRLMSQLFEGVPLRKNLPLVFRLMESLPSAIINRLIPGINLFLDAKEDMDKQSKAV